MGFRFGLYKDGTLNVGTDSEYENTILPDTTVRVVKVTNDLKKKVTVLYNKCC